jgi:alginate O-acetyltransferase complex protein AlgI
LLFNSLQFVFFFPAVVALYFATPARFRWVLLLAASYYFYAAWKPEYLVLIFASTTVDYACARGMGAWGSDRVRRLLLYASITANIGMLFAFKYLNFFSESARAVLAEFNIFHGVPTFDLLLPVGISFYTFQSLSYTIDVYRGQTKPERHFGIFALYVSFFPQLVAGPIERSYRLLPQFFEHRGFDGPRITSGLRLMLWGFFMKLVIADRLAVYVNEVYSNPQAFAPSTLLLATYFFAFQIFCDFAGYSSIAIGAARVLGYELMQNFNRPYFAASIREFWGRWHISLSTWFRDYLYLPLGGNRVERRRWYLNLLVVFIVSGLWHGAAWTFIVWGALHGSYLVVSLVTSGVRERGWQGFAGALTPVPALAAAGAGAGAQAAGAPGATSGAVSDAASAATRVAGSRGTMLQSFPGLARLGSWPAAGRRLGSALTARSGGSALPAWAAAVRRVVAVVVTFHLVLVAWVFFRAESVGDALYVLTAPWNAVGGMVSPEGVDGWQLRLSYLFIGVLLMVHLAQAAPAIRAWLQRTRWYVRWALDYALILGILLFGEFGTQEFIYFQF